MIFRFLKKFILLFLILGLIGITVRYFRYGSTSNDQPSASQTKREISVFIREKNAIFIKTKFEISLYSHLQIKMNNSIIYDERLTIISFSAIRVVVVDSLYNELISSRIYYTNFPDYEADLQDYLSKIYPNYIVLIIHTIKNIQSKIMGLKYFKFSRCFKLISQFTTHFIMAFVADSLDEECYYKENFQKFDNWIDFYINLHQLKTRFFTCSNNFKDIKEYERIKSFCEKYFAFPDLCDCKNNFLTKVNELSAAEEEILSKIPVLIIASNRPYYFVECVKSLLKAKGVQRHMITVDIDEDNPELISLIELFELNIKINPAICSGQCRINNHYRLSIRSIYSKYPELEYIFIFEDDLILSSDILYYFVSLLDIYNSDKSIFCISAWNDHGYKHSVGDLTMLYRIQFMPGLGLCLSKNILNRLLPIWPINRDINWDGWIRESHFGNKVCLIPDVSRTFHIGKFGLHNDPTLQSTHLQPKYFLKEINVILSKENMMKKDYEKFIKNLVKAVKFEKDFKKVCDTARKRMISTILKNPMSFSELVQKSRKVYIHVSKYAGRDKFLEVYKCLKIWDRDNRGYNEWYFRVWINSIHYIIIICPESNLCEDNIPLNF